MNIEVRVFFKAPDGTLSSDIEFLNSLRLLMSHLVFHCIDHFIGPQPWSALSLTTAFVGLFKSFPDIIPFPFAYKKAVRRSKKDKQYSGNFLDFFFLHKRKICKKTGFLGN